MQRRRNNNKRAAVAVTLAATMLAGSGIFNPDPAITAFAASSTTTSSNTTAPSNTPAAPNSTRTNSTTLTSATSLTTFEPFYTEVLADWTGKGYTNGSGNIQVAGGNISAQSADQLTQATTFQGKSNVLLWKSDRDNWIEYKIKVDKTGYYQMNLQYYPYALNQSASANRRPVSLSVAVDGVYPFREARAITFRRTFKDQLPVKQDDIGDDIRPKSLNVDQWIDEPFRDNGGAYNEPLKWYLTQGEHTIRLNGSEPIAIGQLTLAAPETPVDYQTYASKRSADPGKATETVTLQAELMSSKNDAAIQMVVDKDALSLPKAGRHETFNTMGGAKWQIGGQTVNWEFEAPESGLYTISMRAKQNTISNMTTFRTIAVDGKVPFQEFLQYPFQYDTKWLGVTLSDNAGKPYEIYLEKGKHTLSMTATIAPFQPIIVESEEATSQLRELTAELKALTGNVVDKNRTWNISEEFPELLERLQAVRVQMQLMADDMLKANGRRENNVQTLLNAIRDIDTYLRYPNEIPYYMEDISSMQEKIGAIRETLIKTPLQLDQIYIVPASADMPKMEAGIFQKMGNSTMNFFRSFIRKEDLSNLADDALNVWVNRGRDYVNELQEISNELFTPETGIKVKVNLLPDENLLIYANAAGISPDIALGQPQDKSIDFAMRGALEDLSNFPDFQQVANQFAPGALLPFYYDKGYYALPETQTFKMLFYRKDILERLNLKVPDTWDDVYNMLPTLQQSGYNFYVPPTDYITFVYQNGAEFFNPNGMSTALSTPESFKGFKQWTDLFNIYDLEKSVPSFYQHFRKGDMPIGIADFNSYLQIAVGAPELTGWWGMAPLPGFKQANGEVERWSSGGQTTGFIYKSSEKKQEAWEFLKWLLSADVQERYGSDLESFNGITFRWNTANIEAFSRLPWSKDDLKVIFEQWRWYKEMPNLPGSYFVNRELNNAWNRTVVDGMNYRESLEQGIVNIDREMVRKSQEFGFVSPQGEILHTLDLPQVKKPWEGVDRYVPK